jgi:hypothetical protein
MEGSYHGKCRIAKPESGARASFSVLKRKTASRLLRSSPQRSQREDGGLTRDLEAVQGFKGKGGCGFRVKYKKSLSGRREFVRSELKKGFNRKHI